MALFFAQEGQRWPSAVDYADESYQNLRRGKLISFGCIDAFARAEIADTYAFVSLALQAHNLAAEPIVTFYNLRNQPMIEVLTARSKPALNP